MFRFVGMKSTPSMYSVAGVARRGSDWMTLRSIRRAYRVYARYTVSAPMITATSVFIGGSPPSARLPAGSQVLRDERVHSGEVRADVALAVDQEGWIPVQPMDERFEETL